ncbi:CesT family type III secretion system chaperone [Pseudomonas sp. CCOS 191]|uniref:CesT family type III secretion system chaperone n=1 Tax=Pseudomonas sp. CCOS 191 TaxID=1649877 RepID=UPI000624D650|nr:CesT family type III secretion system chaperone [Pseudomonas sp. CCOS 191]CRI56450.1 hypothetical protein CCOS191_1914 [Pseudomonas sp. CCOS 191]
MNTLLNRLARQLGMSPWLANGRGDYHVCIEGHSLYLEPKGTQLLIRSSLSSLAGQGDNLDLHVLRRLMGMLTGWAQHCPQRLVLTPAREPLLEAQVDLPQANLDILDHVLGAQVGLLALLCEQQADPVPVTHGGARVWLP